MECKNYPNCDTNFSSLIEQQAERIKELEAKLYRLYRAAIAEAERQEPVAVYEADTNHKQFLCDSEMARGWRWMRKDFARGDKLFTHHAPVPADWLECIPYERGCDHLDEFNEVGQAYADGWNACRKAMLAAAPKPGEMK